MPLPFVIDWHALYSAAVDVAWLSSIILRHADALTRVALALRAADEAEQRRAIAFVDADDAPVDAPLPDLDAGDDVDASSPFNAHLSSAARRIYGVARLRPKQSEAVSRLLFDEECRGRLILVDRTGGGKSLVLFLTAASVGGITLVLVPLLALTASQLSKLNAAVQRYGTINCVHLDETSPSDLAERVLPKMERIGYDSSESLVLLCSPQYVASTPTFLSALLRCLEKKTLRLIALDEAHLFTMHGATFRHSIRFLRDEFFAIVYALGREYYPLLLAMTATMPESLLRPFSSLTHVNFCDPRHHLWGTAKEFQQRNIFMGLSTKNQAAVKQDALRPIVDLLKTDDEAHVCVFVNFRKEAGRTASVLEDIFAESFVQAGVLTINGDMDKHEKFAFIRLFTSVYRIDGIRFRVLVATAAANTGIDQPLCVRVVRLGLPRCPTTLLQERGRLVRKDGMHGNFTLHSCWQSWIILLVSVMGTSRPGTNEIADHSYANSVIDSRSPMRQRDQAATMAEPERQTRPLTPEERSANTVRHFNDIIDVVNLLFMPAWGCLHLRFEWYLSSKSNTRHPKSFKECHGACETQCYICNRDYRKFMLPVMYDGVMTFLASDHFRLGLHEANPVTMSNAGEITQLLTSFPDYRKMVFAVKTVPNYCVDAFLFQLVASKILTFNQVIKKGKKEIQCALAKDDNEKYLYKNIKYWSGFEFRARQHGAALVPYHSLVSRQGFTDYFHVN
jgi:superfamily II DNA or RNA helicase